MNEYILTVFQPTAVLLKDGLPVLPLCLTLRVAAGGKPLRWGELMGRLVSCGGPGKSLGKSARVQQAERRQRSADGSDVKRKEEGVQTRGLSSGARPGRPEST